MSAHTPGPWVWIERKTLNSAHGKVIDYADYEGMWFAAYNDAVDEANARLIASAPELLETLEWLDSIGGLGVDVHSRIRAEIRKATGGQP